MLNILNRTLARSKCLAKLNKERKQEIGEKLKLLGESGNVFQSLEG
jgi:hypothetical protein